MLMMILSATVFRQLTNRGRMAVSVDGLVVDILVHIYILCVYASILV